VNDPYAKNAGRNSSEQGTLKKENVDGSDWTTGEQANNHGRRDDTCSDQNGGEAAYDKTDYDPDSDEHEGDN
jgi:hypothetical protein